MSKANKPNKAARPRIKWVRYLLLVVIGYSGYHILSGPSGALNLFKLRGANAGERRELDSLTRRRAELEIEKSRLQKDSAYIEGVARKELGMAKPGEKVFRFITPTKPNQGAQESSAREDR